MITIEYDFTEKEQLQDWVTSKPFRVEGEAGRWMIFELLAEIHRGHLLCLAARFALLQAVQANALYAGQWCKTIEPA